MKKACLLAVSVVLAAPAAARADKTVDGSKGQTIQAAIDAASAGETITVLPGTYTENVNVPSGKDGLSLRFNPGAAVSGAASVDSADVKVAGLVLFRPEGTAAALTATGGKLVLTDSTIFATGGDAVVISEADNVIQRSTILTTAATGGADGIAQGPGGLKVDSSIVVGGPKGVGLRVTTAQGSDPATTTLNHATIAGVGGISLEAPDDTVVTSKVGDVTLAVNASIVHGASTATEADGQKDPILGTQLVPASAVKATYTSSDATPMTKAEGSPGDPEITATKAFGPTADAALFRTGTALRLKATAPVIGQGGDVASGESATDIDGDPRKNGDATDIGADEFTNTAPELTFAITPDAPKTGQIVEATATATDKQGADDIIGYAVDWGDGKKDTTASNVIQHVYEKSGTYTVTMLVADQSFTTSAVVSKQITVTDGAPPQLQVTTPASGATVKLSRKKKKGAKRKPKPKTFLIKGVDADESGLSSVELAITKTGSSCKQYNGKKLVSAGCTKYTFVKATLKGNGFSLKAKRLAKGSYEIRARGTDTKGNASSTFDAATKTLVKFKVK